MEYNFEITDNYRNDNSISIEILGTLKLKDLEEIKKNVSSKKVASIRFDFKQTIQTWKTINNIVKENPKLTIVLNFYDYRLKDLLFLEHLTNVEDLVIHYFDGIDISPIAHLEKIKHLMFTSDFRSAKVRLKPLTNLKKLEYLKIYNIKDVEEISNFINLKKISLHNLKTDNLNFMSTLHNLEELALYGSHKVLDYSGLYNLPKLKNAYINWNHKNTTAEFLTHLVHLERLHLLNFSLLRNFPNLDKLKKLKSLSITSCKTLSDISGISKAPNLEEVSLHIGKEFKPTALNVLKGHKKLREISASFNTKTEDAIGEKIIKEILNKKL